jgi:hypothetical protein
MSEIQSLQPAHPPLMSLTKNDAFAGLPPMSFSNEILHVNPSRRYRLVSPCRDEGEYVRRTLDSVAITGGSRGLGLTISKASAVSRHRSRAQSSTKSLGILFCAMYRLLVV